MSELSIPIPVWDNTLSRTLAFADIGPKIIDYAIAIGLASALDEFGVAYALFTPQRFFAYFGAAPQPRPPMGACGEGSAVIATWTALNLLTIQQKTKLVLLKTALCTLTPNEFLMAMEDDQGSLRSRSSQFIFSELETQLGVLTSADLDVLHLRLNNKYDRSLSIESFVALYQSTLRALARAQQPISNNMAIGILQGCFTLDWTQCWVRFVVDYPIVAGRTVANMCHSIIIFARDALPIIAAQPAIDISLMKGQATAEEIALREEIAELRAYVATVKQQPPSRPTTKPSLHRSKKKKQKANIAAQDTVKSPPLEPTQSVVLPVVSTSGWANAVKNNSNIAPVLATSDTGATGTYLQTQDMHTLHDVHVSAAGEQIIVAVANGTLLRSTHHGRLHIPGHGTILAHVLPQLKGSLLSVSQLVDLGLRVMYCSAWVTVTLMIT